MAEYDNTNRGIIFKNDKKGNEKAPEYTGKSPMPKMEKEIEFLKFQETNSQNDYLPVILDGKTTYITWKMIVDAIKEKYGDLNKNFK